MRSETSPRSCVPPLCIGHCRRPSLSGQSGVSSETSASLLECPRENSSPGQGAMDGRRPSPITAPSPFLQLKAVCRVSGGVGGGFGRLQKHFRQQNTKYLPGEDRQAASKPAYFIQYSFISTICVNLGGDRCAPKIKKNSVSHCPKVSSPTAKATIPTQKHCQSSSQILFTRRTRPRGPGLNR